MKLGMFTSGYQYYPLEAAFQDAKRIGYDYIELWGGRPHAFPPDLKRGGIEQVKELIEVYEMPVHVYTPEHNAYPYNYMIGDSSQRKEAVDYLKTAIEMGKEMGAEYTLISTGHAENTAVAKLEYENGTFNVVFRDDASHLGDEIATVRKQPWVNDPKGFEGGIYYRASGEAGHFDVMHGGDVIGAVSVVSCRGGVGTIGEFWLEEDVQKRNLGEKLVGQALSYARSRGCSILSTGRIPKSNAVGLHCAEKWGFRPVQEDAESVTFEKNFEYDEESCYRRLQEVIEK